MNDSKFRSLVRSLENTYFDVEQWPSSYDHNELFYDGELELDLDLYVLHFRYTVTETGREIPSTYLQPAEWVRESLSVEIVYAEVYDGNEGHLIPLDNKQENSLEKILEKKIEKQLK